MTLSELRTIWPTVRLATTNTVSRGHFRRLLHPGGSHCCGGGHCCTPLSQTDGPGPGCSLGGQHLPIQGTHGQNCGVHSLSATISQSLFLVLHAGHPLASHSAALPASSATPPYRFPLSLLFWIPLAFGIAVRRRFCVRWQDPPSANSGGMGLGLDVASSTLRWPYSVTAPIISPSPPADPLVTYCRTLESSLI